MLLLAWLLPLPCPLAQLESDKPQAGFSLDRLNESLDSARLHRIDKNFALAMSELDKLKDIPDKENQLRIRLARAEVCYDMENYSAACQEIDRALELEPKHPESLILRGKCHLKMRGYDNKRDLDCFVDKKLIHEVKIGDPITVNLLAPSLEFAGEIEVVITSGLGDRETIMLERLESDRTRYRARLETSAGKPQSDDKVLQTKIGDEISIEYSQITKAKMSISEARATKMNVVAGE